MEKKGTAHLTNQKLAGKFKSNFDLVNYAIKLAENMIHTGRDARVKSDIENRAMLILEEIYEGKDQFDDIKQVDASPASGAGVDGNVYHSANNEEKVERRKHTNVGAKFRDE